MIAWFLASTAFAHEPGLSYARVDHHELAQTFSTVELAAFGTPEELGPVLEGLTFARSEVAVDGHRCDVGPSRVRAVEGDGLEIQASLDCPAGTTWTYEAAFLPDLAPGHRHYVEAFGQPVAVLDATGPVASFSRGSTTRGVALEFARLGVEHILTGLDHIAFLLALLLVATSLRQMLAIVTGFTVAHSITLSVAATGLFTPSPDLVEPAIALTIAYTGLENLWRPGARRRFLVTFLLGLIHGFGFAGLLLELGLPRDHLVTALLCFNGGVEIGQALMVALVLPLLLLAARRPTWNRCVVPTVSVLIAAAGLYWFVDRLVG